MINSLTFTQTSDNHHQQTTYDQEGRDVCSYVIGGLIIVQGHFWGNNLVG